MLFSVSAIIKGLIEVLISLKTDLYFNDLLPNVLVSRT